MHSDHITGCKKNKENIILLPVDWGLSARALVLLLEGCDEAGLARALWWQNTHSVVQCSSSAVVVSQFGGTCSVCRMDKSDFDDD